MICRISTKIMLSSVIIDMLGPMDGGRTLLIGTCIPSCKVESTPTYMCWWRSKS